MADISGFQNPSPFTTNGSNTLPSSINQPIPSPKRHLTILLIFSLIFFFVIGISTFLLWPKIQNRIGFNKVAKNVIVLPITPDGTKIIDRGVMFELNTQVKGLVQQGNDISIQSIDGAKLPPILLKKGDSLLLQKDGSSKSIDRSELKVGQQIRVFVLYSKGPRIWDVQQIVIVE